MGKLIKFEIETEANYDEDEMEGLLNSLTDFVSSLDPDVVSGTESVEIVDSNSSSENPSKDEIIRNFLAGADVTVSLNITGEDGPGFEMTLK